MTLAVGSVAITGLSAAGAPAVIIGAGVGAGILLVAGGITYAIINFAVKKK